MIDVDETMATVPQKLSLLDRCKASLGEREYDAVEEHITKPRRTIALEYQCHDIFETRSDHAAFRRLCYPGNLPQPSKIGLLLIEDVDITWLSAVDGMFHLDPRFLLAYVSRQAENNIFANESLRSGPPPPARGLWYTSDTRVHKKPSWGVVKPQRPVLLRCRPDGHNGRPVSCDWWEEPLRQEAWGDGLKFISRIGCYCLSEKARKSRGSAPWKIPADTSYHQGLILVESSLCFTSRAGCFSDMRMKFHGLSRQTDPWAPVFLGLDRRGQGFSIFDSFQMLVQQASSHHRSILLIDDRKLTDVQKVMQPLDQDEPSMRHRDWVSWPLVECAWRLNIVALREALASRRYEALTRPGMKTYLPLVQLRQVIVGMRDVLPGAIVEGSKFVDLYKEAFVSCSPDKLPTLPQTLVQVQSDLGKLDKELNDEIHLIIGAVTVQDSDAMKQQAERATLLTLLAAVYLPLTLVTGIFGMNIADIDRDTGKPTWKHCLEALAVAAACTITFVLAYRYWRHWRRKRAEREVEIGQDWKQDWKMA